MAVASTEEANYDSLQCHGLVSTNVPLLWQIWLKPHTCTLIKMPHTVPRMYIPLKWPICVQTVHLFIYFHLSRKFTLHQPFPMVPFMQFCEACYVAKRCIRATSFCSSSFFTTKKALLGKTKKTFSLLLNMQLASISCGTGQFVNIGGKHQHANSVNLNKFNFGIPQEKTAQDLPHFYQPL